MKTIGEVVTGRDPTAEERATLADVLEIARAWEAGTLPLSGVRTACSGHERWTAMRWTGVHNADKDVLLRLATALVRDIGDLLTKAGPLTRKDLEDHGGWVHPDANGRRIIRFRTMDSEGRAYFRDIPPWKLAEGER